MIDIRKSILKALYSLLSTQSIPVYSLVPDNVGQPFIYIGEVISETYPVKCNFHRNGNVNVELYYELNEADGSLDTMLDKLQEIKTILLPNPRFVLDLTASGLAMSSWELDYEEGPYVYTDDRRLLTASMQLGFLVGQVATSALDMWDIIHVADDVIFGNDNLIHIR